MRALKINEETTKEMFSAVADLSKEQKDHLQQLIQLLLCAYKTERNPEAGSAVLVIKPPKEENIALVTVNANEFDAAELLDIARQAHHEYLISDAPAPDRFN